MSDILDFSSVNSSNVCFCLLSKQKETAMRKMKRKCHLTRDERDRLKGLFPT